jgi:hypothetical protein
MRRLPYELKEMDLHACVSIAMRFWHMDFAHRLYVDGYVIASDFSLYCAVQNEPVALRHMLDTGPGKDLETLCRLAAERNSAGSLRVLLEYGAPLTSQSLLCASRDNRLDVLQVALEHITAWCPQLPTVAAFAGNARFLMRMFDAGCPVWTTAQDGQPELYCNWETGLWEPVRRAHHRPDRSFLRKFPREAQSMVMQDWSLVVSSDLLRSGPVLLLAAQKGAPLTPRMKRMLRKVRRRALALACCFHRAARLSRGHGAAARKWDSMGRVPVELVQNIATLARVSIVVHELVE